MTSHVTQDIRLLYEAVYDQDLREKAYEYNVYAQFETWIDNLISEGYDLSEYTWEDMYDYYISEANRGDRNIMEVPQKLDEGKVELKQRNKNEMQRKAGNLGREVVSTPNTKKNAAKRNAAMDRMVKLVSAIGRDDEEKRFKTINREQVDIYDIILSHLLDEGYAETPEEATVIMTNMSEEWREDILTEGFKRMNRSKIEKQAKRLGGDRGDSLTVLAKRLDTPVERRYSTSQARKNRAGSGEYRTRQHLRARDDARADIEKYGLH